MYYINDTTYDSTAYFHLYNKQGHEIQRWKSCSFSELTVLVFVL